MTPSNVFIIIGPDGLVFRTLAWSRRRWSDIEGDFVVFKLGWTQAVGYRLTHPFKESAGIKPTTMFADNYEAFGGTYDVTIDELAKILNQHKRRAMIAS